MTTSSTRRGPQVEAIRAALSDPALPQEAADLYGGILEMAKDVAEANRRSIAGLLLVAGATELLNRAAVSGAQLGPFTVTDLSAIRKILPLIAAYLMYDTTTHSIQLMYSKLLLGAINRAYRPALYVSRYARLTHPRTSPLFGPFPWHESQTAVHKMINVLVTMLKTGGAATPLLLLLYWFVRLFDAFGYTDSLLWISSVISAGFALLAVLAGIEAIRSGLISDWRAIFSHHWPRHWAS